MEKTYDETLQLISKTFDYDIVVDAKKITEEEFIAEATDRLRPAIEHLLEKDYNRLLAILYRIDVQENRLKECFSSTNFIDAATCIAKAVVERQIMKIKMRAKKG